MSKHGEFQDGSTWRLERDPLAPPNTCMWMVTTEMGIYACGLASGHRMIHTLLNHKDAVEAIIDGTLLPRWRDVDGTLVARMGLDRYIVACVAQSRWWERWIFRRPAWTWGLTERPTRFHTTFHITGYAETCEQAKKLAGASLIEHAKKLRDQGVV